MSGAVRGGYLSRPAPSGLADVVETILNKGLVIDAYARLSVVGIEVLTVDARVVVSSVDTYLRFAEATNRLDLWQHGGHGLPDVLGAAVGHGTKAVATTVVEHKTDDAFDRVGDVLGEPVERVARATARTAITGAEKLVD